ncbi:hypothetical protein RT97_00905 [Variovorax paradoxus]|jgi:hypothetical protein|uniref:Uncharacterized protein n=1 Tax=Variovorax paradoxus TaxID=34073 RepID=A0A0D0MWI2_VARPD|nr:DUF4150 domain-containing protein [Variovorax paradoxus]KIQ36971.1 hypothetical protein RT97_00905 [Variovorax paradoxus]
MLATHQWMGGAMAFPDVCKMPFPFPFFNLGLRPMTIPACWHILLFGGPMHNLFAKTPITLLDQPGVLGGVISQVFMQMQRHITGSFTLLLRGGPATRLTSLAVQNRMNIVGFECIPGMHFKFFNFKF